MKFLFKGIAEVSDEATNTAKKILAMKDWHSSMINQQFKNPSNGLKLLEKLYENPLVTINKVADMLGVCPKSHFDKDFSFFQTYIHGNLCILL